MIESHWTHFYQDSKGASQIMNKRYFGLPLYGILGGIAMTSVLLIMYTVPNIVAHFFEIPWHSVRIDAIDDAIPLIPPMALIYVLFYPFNLLSPMFASRYGTKEWFVRYMQACLIAYTTGFVIFLAYPTYIDRVAEDLYARAGDGFFGWGLRCIYDHDGVARGTNLFPSYHCLSTVMCLIGYYQKGIPGWLKGSMTVFAVCIFASTVMIKQHYFADVVSAIAIGLTSWLIICKLRERK